MTRGSGSLLEPQGARPQTVPEVSSPNHEEPIPDGYAPHSRDNSGFQYSIPAQDPIPPGAPRRSPPGIVRTEPHPPHVILEVCAPWTTGEWLGFKTRFW